MTFLQAVLSASFEADQNEEDAYNKGSSVQYRPSGHGWSQLRTDCGGNFSGSFPFWNFLIRSFAWTDENFSPDPAYSRLAQSCLTASRPVPTRRQSLYRWHRHPQQQPMEKKHETQGNSLGIRQEALSRTAEAVLCGSRCRPMSLLQRG